MRVALPAIVGGVSVERRPASFLSAEADASAPRKGITHTTEGSFESAHAVFLQSNAPHVLIGRDSSRKLRIIEYAPIGVMAHALKNVSGGVETNRLAVFQVEIAGFRQVNADPLLAPGKIPMDDAFRRVLAELMAEVNRLGGVPLKRGGDGTRSLSRWKGNAGWFGHLEVPENDHTDPGALNYARLFAMAAPPPWKLVKDGRIYARGTLSQLSNWLKTHSRKVRRLGGLNLRRNR